MEKLNIEQILKDNHFNALDILSKAHCKDGISGTEKDRLINGIKAIIEKTVEITLDEAGDNAETKDNEIDPKKVIKVEPILIREGSSKKLTNNHLVETQEIIAKIIQKVKLLF